MPDLDYVKLVGRLGLTAADGSDVDDDPDTIWCNEGIVRVTPLITYTKVAGGSPVPWTAGNASIDVLIGSDGRLTHNGKDGVWLVDLTSDKVNPQIAPNRATHRVEFIGVKADGTDVRFPSMEVRLVGPEVNDLTVVSPVPSGNPVPIVRGERGVGVQSAEIDGGDLLLALDDGSEINAGELPVGPGGSDAGVASYITTPGSETATALADSIAEVVDPVAEVIDTGRLSAANVAAAQSAAAKSVADPLSLFVAVRELARVELLPPPIDTPTITYASASTIASGQIKRERREGGVTGAALDMTTDPNFRYLGFPSAAAWSASPNFFVEPPLIPGGVSQGRRWEFQVECETNATEIEYVLHAPSAGARPFAFLVNGRLYANSVTHTLSGQIYVKLAFPDARVRRIRMIGNGAMRWQGAVISSGATIARSTQPITRIGAAVGDSLTVGSGTAPDGANSWETWAYRTLLAMGCDLVINAGIGGTKWVPSGSGDVAVSHYGGGRLTALLAMGVTDLVFAGSRNDSATNQAALDAITAAVTAALTAVSAVPNVYVAGTFTNLPQNPAVKAAAVAKGRPFIDLHSAIYGTGKSTAPTGDGNADFYINNDGVHITLAGHRYLEKLMTAGVVRSQAVA